MNKALIILGLRVTILPILVFAIALALIAKEFLLATLLVGVFGSVLYWLRIQRRAIAQE
ncbi:MAG: hypothetical protein ACMXYD_05135 [Candidatus Woesearchaeota archaeon]